MKSSFSLKTTLKSKKHCYISVLYSCIVSDLVLKNIPMNSYFIRTMRDFEQIRKTMSGVQRKKTILEIPACLWK